MIAHVVSFRFRPGVTWDDPRATAAERVTRDHPAHIPQILGWTLGRNITNRQNSYDFGLVGHFADRVALDTYLSHPDHRRGVAAWREISTWVVLDLEVDVPVAAGVGGARVEAGYVPGQDVGPRAEEG